MNQTFESVPFHAENIERRTAKPVHLGTSGAMQRCLAEAQIISKGEGNG
jgi:hypothetical protein